MRTGFFVSCRLNKESKGLKEVAGKLQGLVEPLPATEGGRSIKQTLDDEIEEYKSSTRFVRHDGYRCILLLENRSRESSLSLFYKLRASGARFEYVCRVVPLERFFRFDEEKVVESIKGLDKSKTYKIVYEERMCSAGMKERVFGLITSHLALKVDLKTPDYTVVVQGFKNSIGISVVEGERENFNFSTM